jgi:hypothetical protein
LIIRRNPPVSGKSQHGAAMMLNRHAAITGRFAGDNQAVCHL